MTTLEKKLIVNQKQIQKKSDREMQEKVAMEEVKEGRKKVMQSGFLNQNFVISTIWF